MIKGLSPAARYLLCEYVAMDIQAIEIQKEFAHESKSTGTLKQGCTVDFKFTSTRIVYVLSAPMYVRSFHVDNGDYMQNIINYIKIYGKRIIKL